MVASNPTGSSNTVNVITLWSGTELRPVAKATDKDLERSTTHVDKETQPEDTEKIENKVEGNKSEKKEEEIKENPFEKASKELQLEDLPFPRSYLMSKKQANDKQDKEIIDLFSKLEVNMPLAKLVRKVSRYAKVLKHLCTKKRNFRPNMKVQVSSNISVLFKPQLLIKCKDLGSFIVPCIIGKVVINGDLLDLGATINVMPKAVYESLGIKSLKDTCMILQLADKTCRYPQGIVEDVIVKVKDLVFPTNFYVLDMDNGKTSDSTLILGGLSY